MTALLQPMELAGDVDRDYRLVTGTVQDALSDLAEERTLPVVG